MTATGSGRAIASYIGIATLYYLPSGGDRYRESRGGSAYPDQDVAQADQSEGNPTRFAAPITLVAGALSHDLIRLDGPVELSDQ